MILIVLFLFPSRKQLERSNIPNFELLYYSSKILDLIDHKIIFLQKFYQYLYSIYTNHSYGIYNFFYYKDFKKYESFFDLFKLNLPINYEEFIKLYQNTDDTHFSFADIYPLDKHYKSEVLDNRNIIYDLNSYLDEGAELIKRGELIIREGKKPKVKMY